MAFQYERTIRFQDTDAAGVVYFAQVLSICHEAYEASLQAAGLPLQSFFSRGKMAVPITHAQADFRRPLRCGDRTTVQLVPHQSALESFEIEYTVLTADGKIAAIANTRHTCIETATRQRHPLTPELLHWLQQWTEVVP